MWILKRVPLMIQRNFIGSRSILTNNVDSNHNVTFLHRVLEFFEKTMQINNTEHTTKNSFDLLRLTTERQEKYAISSKISSKVPSSQETDKLENLHVLTNLQKITNLIESLKTLKQSENTEDLLNDVDMQCCKQLNALSYQDILWSLYIFIKIAPSNASKTTFYGRCLEILSEAVVKEKLNARAVIQVLFFAGQKKKFGTEYVKLLLRYVPKFDELTLMEHCIVALAAFKTGVKLKLNYVQFFEDMIERHTKDLVNDPAMLVTLCKVLRHAGPTKDCFLKNLSNEIISTKQKFPVIYSAHIITLYAEAKVSNTEVFDRLFNDMVDHFSQQSTIPPENESQHLNMIRTKDIKRLLWAANWLNYKLKKNDLDKIVEFIDQRFDDFTGDMKSYIDILLSLWILGHDCREKIQKCFERELFKNFLSNEILWTHRCKLTLLLNCIHIENPEIKIPDELNKKTIELMTRSTVKNVYKVVIALSHRIQLNDIMIECPVEGLRTAGVSMKHLRFGRIHIDVLDRTTYLKNKIPHGYMNLKLRLIKKLGYHSILINVDYFEDLNTTFLKTERCIRNFLENESSD